MAAEEPRVHPQLSEDAVRAYLPFARMVLKRWRGRNGTDGAPVVHRVCATFSSSGRGSEIWKVNSHERYLKDELDADLPNLPKALDAVMAFWLAGFYHSPGSAAPDEFQRRQLLAALLWPLTQILNRDPDAVPSSRELRTALRRHFHPKAVPFEIVIPLNNVTVVGVVHCSGFKLSEFTPEQKAIWHRQDDIDLMEQWLLPKSALANVRAIAIKRYAASEDESSRGDATADATRLVTALRLLCPGSIGAPLIQIRSRQPCMWIPAELAGVGDAGWVELRATSHREFTQILRELNASIGGAEIELSIRRFNLSYARSSAEDRILDLMICLEGCLLRDTEQRDLAYKFRMRGFAALDGSLSPRDMDVLGLCYNVRSKIVHEGMLLSGSKLEKLLQNKGLTPETLSDRLESIARRVIRRFLHSIAKGEKAIDVAKKLDSRLLQGLQPPLSAGTVAAELDDPRSTTRTRKFRKVEL